MDELELLVATCRSVINCHFNLDLIAKKLELDDRIVGKKLINICEEGLIKQTVKKEIDLTTRQDFSNQLTIIIHIDNHIHKDDGTELSLAIGRKLKMKLLEKKQNRYNSNNSNRINIKLFRNGKIMTTGGLSMDDAEYSINVFLKKILTDDFYEQYKINEDCSIDSLFKTMNDYVKFVEKSYLSIYYMMYYFNVDVNFNAGIILNIKKRKNFNWNDLLNDISDKKTFSKIIQIMIQLLNYFHNDEIITIMKRIIYEKHEPSDNYFIEFIENLYNGKEVKITATFNEKVDEFTTEISNFNSKFASGIKIDRHKLTEIIKTKYQDNIISCVFEPLQNYQGINVKFKSSIDDNEIPNTANKIKNNKKCDSKLSNTTILIFQTGEVIINGSRQWEKNIEAYNFIKSVLFKEKDEIHVKLSEKKIITKTPMIIEDGNDTYINFYEAVLKTPKNALFLKKNNLFDIYKEKYMVA